MKELGVGTLRDGVALLPASDDHYKKLQAVRAQVEHDAGTAWLFELPGQGSEVDEVLRGLFDRTDAFREIRAALDSCRSELPRLDEPDARRQLRQLERELRAISQIEFFPTGSDKDLRDALNDLKYSINQQFSPQEPSSKDSAVESLDIDSFQGRVWATRRRMWVDRIASAWLVRRFIDENARFLWLEHPEDCPDDALGFDFDGATFSHAGELITFEVLMASFGLGTQPGLREIGRLVHYLDVGGESLPEAAGFEAILAGLRDCAPDDDALLDASTPILDALLRRFSATHA